MLKTPEWHAALIQGRREALCLMLRCLDEDLDKRLLASARNAELGYGIKIPEGFLDPKKTVDASSENC